ncbi:metallophosphoesterase family protein [Roseibacillus ishigakijimensis]|uniref:Metallophosphoesterase n=1 Tax=Roseibacillus ishigakijimensis TaxID=454146 RepID=A0A934VKC1_9BACT|nr:metallophosphoesterase family protein [Roseibacillus ishigakijimensis]MBK1833494.1 metallophosphoesterase [Roseibacillus ishigakijimensis]
MKLTFLPLAWILTSPLGAEVDRGEPPVKAPFEKGEDSLATNDWWNRKETDIIDLRVPRDEVVAFGIYTTHQGVLKLSAQLYPLYPEETREVRLEVEREGQWVEIARQEVNDLGWCTSFRIADWEMTKDVKYRLRHGAKASFEGLIRKDPVGKKDITVAALSCNSNRDRGLRPEYTRNINAVDPDLIFFAGDQSYDHRQHTAAWLKFGLAFKELFRNRPCVTIPDDHDIGQGNLWGEGGKKCLLPAGSDGGYFFHPEYVQMVERQQCGHLPDPYDPTPVEQGIGVYYTNLLVGGIDFAILEDRKFKTGPKDRHPMKGPRPDHIRDENYDPQVVDVPGLKLLGDRQLYFLEDWSDDTEGVSMKAVLSQTGFCGGAHLHGSPQNRLHADMDSNGWPQTPRNEALRLIQKANAVHIAGDQHLSTLIKHGIDEYGDGPWAFVVPAIVNTYYGRWWWPEDEKAGGNPPANSPLPWVGDYQDGFGNKITMYAYANPTNDPSQRNAGKFDPEGWGDGWGLIRFHKEDKDVTFECWPRFADLTEESAEQFPGWPKTISLD